MRCLSIAGTPQGGGSRGWVPVPANQTSFPWRMVIFGQILPSAPGIVPKHPQTLTPGGVKGSHPPACPRHPPPPGGANYEPKSCLAGGGERNPAEALALGGRQAGAGHAAVSPGPAGRPTAASPPPRPSAGGPAAGPAGGERPAGPATEGGSAAATVGMGGAAGQVPSRALGRDPEGGGAGAGGLSVGRGSERGLGWGPAGIGEPARRKERLLLFWGVRVLSCSVLWPIVPTFLAKQLFRDLSLSFLGPPPRAGLHANYADPSCAQNPTP